MQKRNSLEIARDVLDVFSIELHRIYGDYATISVQWCSIYPAGPEGDVLVVNFDHPMNSEVLVFTDLDALVDWTRTSIKEMLLHHAERVDLSIDDYLEEPLSLENLENR